jgi:putative transposase
MIVTKAHRIRLNPTPQQATHFLRTAGIARFAWNWCLDEYKRIKALGNKVDWNALKKTFRRNIDTDFPWVREGSKCAFEGAIADLRRAIATYYKAKVTNPKLRFPGYRKRSRGIGGFVVDNCHFRAEGHEAFLPKVGAVNMAESLRFEGKIVSGRVQEKAGCWYLTVVVEAEQKEGTPAERADVGIDFGLSTFAVLSTGEVYETQGHFRRAQRRLRGLQRALARKHKGSRNRVKAKQKVARCHRRVSAQRSDFLHKMTTEVVRKYSIVCVEDLNLVGLCRTRLAKSFTDAGIGEALRQLDYKSAWYGGELRRVDRFFPSSKRCHGCGLVNAELTLTDRVWTCSCCGSVHDRDENAARNLYLEGLGLPAGSGYVGVTPVERTASAPNFGSTQADVTKQVLSSETHP